jgi:hypothetical protein
MQFIASCNKLTADGIMEAELFLFLVASKYAVIAF